MRDKTRNERYNEKAKSAKTFPISLTTINFRCDENLGYLIRSAACFGAESVNVIGSVPPRSILNPLSGSLHDYDLDTFSFNFEKKISIIVGNETSGVPIELLANSIPVYIEMPGIGFCLNTSQAANILLYEAVKQYKFLQKYFENLNQPSYAVLT
jgi:tRNA G18 (ribose-2'-O)-methylase SpoU